MTQVKKQAAASSTNPKDASNDTTVNTGKKVVNDGEKRLPHERDQSPDAQSIQPKKVMQQAKADLDAGQVDTDMHGERGVEKVSGKNPRQ